jgi:hypothetical protein
MAMTDKRDWTRRADDAANFLTETDGLVASLKTGYEIAKKKSERIRSATYLREAGTVEERKSRAIIHEDYKNAVAEEMEALQEYETLRNRRDTAHTVIDFWRSYYKATQEGVV